MKKLFAAMILSIMMLAQAEAQSSYQTKKVDMMKEVNGEWKVTQSSTESIQILFYNNRMIVSDAAGSVYRIYGEPAIKDEWILYRALDEQSKQCVIALSRSIDNPRVGVLYRTVWYIYYIE